VCFWIAYTLELGLRGNIFLEDPARPSSFGRSWLDQLGDVTIVVFTRGV
jgi:hypothetical protein